MKAFLYSQNTVFQNPNANVDFHWFNGSSNKHLHSDYYELIIIIEGDFTHTYLGKTIPLSRGDVILIKPKYYHLQTSDQQKSLLANFSLTVDAFKTITKNINEDVYKRLKTHSGEPVQLADAELNHLVDSLNAHHTIHPQTNSILDYFYISIMHWLLAIMDLHYAKSHSSQLNNYPAWLNVFLEKLQDPKTFCLPIAKIYSLSKYSQSRLIHLFTKYVGIPPVQHVTNLKIDYAKKLLVKTNHSVTDIAFMLNYSSLTYFIALFKKHTGTSPTEYRRKYYINVPANAAQ